MASIITKLNKPYLLVANKIDDKSHEMDALIYCELGMNNPYVVSAQSGRGGGDVLDKVNEIFPQEKHSHPEDPDQINTHLTSFLRNTLKV